MTDKELLKKWEALLDPKGSNEKLEKILYLMKEIKLERQTLLARPTREGTTSLIIWFDTLLFALDEALQSNTESEVA